MTKGPLVAGLSLRVSELKMGYQASCFCLNSSIL